MRGRSMKPWTLAVAVLGGIGVVIPLLNGAVLPLSLAAGLAVLALILGAGWARVLPGMTLVAIVVAAHCAPVKSRDGLPSRRITVPKAVMTLAELRDPHEHGLDGIRAHPPLYFPRGPDVGPARFDHLTVHFPSTEMTVREFVRSIEGQTPLRHAIGTCGTDATILGGSIPMALVFSEPRS
ncbi:hypothetical protein [Paludisphaera sp.]|uniref:hypothetical protein n=1 Tax=Paludisphaera sp. TaxID=2017432 RepID=UPI00301DE30B